MKPLECVPSFYFFRERTVPDLNVSHYSLLVLMVINQLDLCEVSVITQFNATNRNRCSNKQSLINNLI